ncbi:DUF2147 domain-containing protein [Chitinimonas sp. BJB300]|uniref:DUF2147 domain-containing protein n=1 Tax=Chitinimonas sp. BJB300 TaxID=1559339 RepID=UPI000C0D449F|nr:DUF2147 domain-containing protein [Chitinimonas sp. BJB300]PHV10778.1 hypothetical protein CSQ89_14470 [Chitinimonas sp. BJB300]TSJ84513.1 DUF2147 domain-containing protein [Chitinimonas sp. BJB300]
MRLHAILAFGLLLLDTGPVLADVNSPVGSWKNISDKTKKVEAVIQIWEENGELHGKLTKLFESKETNCTACKGDKQNKPLLGLEIIWGVRKNGDEWTGGEILDPSSGDIYSVKMRLAEQGQQLKVRGFLGISLFGRTQTWLRDQ